MRIRDWSSDVCSSDLGGGHRLGRPLHVVAGRQPVVDVDRPHRPTQPLAGEEEGSRVGSPRKGNDQVTGGKIGGGNHLAGHFRQPTRTDRQRSVYGTQVSVTDELGGRTSHQKKK